MKILKVKIILILLFLILLIIPGYVKASGESATGQTSETTQTEQSDEGETTQEPAKEEKQKPSWDNFWESGAGFIKEGDSDLINEASLTNEFGGMIKVLVATAIVILISAVLIIGIKYMVAEPKQQAELKKKLVGLVIATVIIAGAYTIWSVTYNMMAGIEHEMIEKKDK